MLRLNTLQPGKGEMEVCCAGVVRHPKSSLFPPLSLPPPNHQCSHIGPSPLPRPPPLPLSLQLHSLQPSPPPSHCLRFHRHRQRRGHRRRRRRIADAISLNAAIVGHRHRCSNRCRCCRHRRIRCSHRRRHYPRLHCHHRRSLH